MKSYQKRRSIKLGGQRIRFTIENDFWDAIDEVGGHEKLAAELPAQLGGSTAPAHVAAALRLLVLDHCRKKAAGGGPLVGQVRELADQGRWSSVSPADASDATAGDHSSTSSN